MSGRIANPVSPYGFLNSLSLFIFSVAHSCDIFPSVFIFASASSPIAAVKVTNISLPTNLDESYSIEINSHGIQLSAPSTEGALHGLETILQ
ncbi:MAG: hypothetical protein C5B59_20025 [Bacteroidetes bacterium]|nr:MAG: hypothetical protein C5B59_20025 [Bacteroidota bacterium]